MPDIPEEAVEAAHERFWEAKTMRIDSYENMHFTLQRVAPALREQERERAAAQIRALRVYRDDEIAARRGPLEDWVRRDDVLAALEDSDA